MSLGTRVGGKEGLLLPGLSAQQVETPRLES